MVIHSSSGRRKKKKILPKEELKQSVTPISKEKVVIEESITPTVVEDPTAEEFIATLPKKQSRKKVTKIIEE